MPAVLKIELFPLFSTFSWLKRLNLVPGEVKSSEHFFFKLTPL